MDFHPMSSRPGWAYTKRCTGLPMASAALPLPAAGERWRQAPERSLGGMMFKEITVQCISAGTLFKLAGLGLALTLVPFTLLMTLGLWLYSRFRPLTLLVKVAGNEAGAEPV